MTKSLKHGISPTYAPNGPSPTFLHQMTKNEHTPSSGNTPHYYLIPFSLLKHKTFISILIGGTRLDPPLRMVRIVKNQNSNEI